MKKILSLMKENIINGRRVRIFESDYYTVKVIKTQYSVNVSIFPKNEFTPQIYTKYNYDTGNIIEFEIGTTSYGGVTKEDIKKIIEGYEVALLTVEQLEELLKNYIEK